jgi:cysteinyl-tRNA synthetase
MSDIKGFEKEITFIHKTVSRLKSLVESNKKEGDSSVEARFQQHIDSFFRAMDNDLDTPKALDALKLLIKELNNNMNRVNQDLLKIVLTMLFIIGLEPSSGE